MTLLTSHITELLMVLLQRGCPISGTLLLSVDVAEKNSEVTLPRCRGRLQPWLPPGPGLVQPRVGLELGLGLGTSLVTLSYSQS